MPPRSAAERQAPEPLSVDDSSAGQQRQAVLNFQARKKLLSGTNNNNNASPATKKNKKRNAKGSSAAVVRRKPAASLTAEPSSSQPLDATTNGGPMSNYGGAMGGLGGGYGMGGMMMGSPYSMMGSPYGMGGGGPLNSLNQFLFGIQTAIYSLSSAVQVIGMNTHALQQLLDAASSMVDHALATWHEMRALEANATGKETDEQKMRRRRLKALRWALVVSATYAAYRLIKSLATARKQRHRRRLTPAADPYANNNGYSASTGAYSPYPQQQPGMYGMSPYNNATPGMGGLYGGAYGGGYGGGGYGGGGFF